MYDILLDDDEPIEIEGLSFLLNAANLHLNIMSETNGECAMETIRDMSKMPKSEN